MQSNLLIFIISSHCSLFIFVEVEYSSLVELQLPNTFPCFLTKLWVQIFSILVESGCIRDVVMLKNERQSLNSIAKRIKKNFVIFKFSYCV